MTAQADACTHLNMRAGIATHASVGLAVAAAGVGLARFVPHRWRPVGAGVALPVLAYFAFLAFILRQWDPSCGPVASHVGACTHPVWILALPLVFVGATVVVLLGPARRW